MEDPSQFQDLLGQRNITGDNLFIVDLSVSGQLLAFPLADSTLVIDGGFLRVNDLGIQTGNVAGGAITDAKIDSMSASKLIGEFDEDLIPATDELYNLGSVAKKWNHLYVKDLTIADDITVDNVFTNADSTYSIGTNLVRFLNVYSDNLYGEIQEASQTKITSIGILSSLTMGGQITSHNILPDTNSSRDIGSNLIRYSDIYSDSIYGEVQEGVQTKITQVGTLTGLTVSGDIVPSVNFGASLGSLSFQFNNIYGNTILGNNLGGTITASYASQPNITSLGNLTALNMSGHIIPSADLTYDLGTSSRRFRDIYAEDIHHNNTTSDNYYLTDTNVGITRNGNVMELFNTVGSIDILNAEVNFIGSSPKFYYLHEQFLGGYSVEEYHGRINAGVLQETHRTSWGLSTLTIDKRISSAGAYSNVLIANDNNSALGNGVLDALTSGAGNTSIGVDTGEKLTTGSSNTYLGLRAGNSNLTESYQLFIGVDAGGNSTTGDELICIGREAGQNSSAPFGVFIGSFAGENATSGSNNCVFIGYSAGIDSAGTGNTVCGHRGGQGLGAGEFNSFLGNDAGRSVSTGDNNCALGNGAMYLSAGNAITGNHNIGIGSETCGAGADTGLSSSYNFCAVSQAGRNLDTTSADNIIIGRSAGTRLEANCNNNIILGKSLNTGSTLNVDSNIIIGDSNLPNITSDNNIAIGNNLGSTNPTTGTRNIYIGTTSITHTSNQSDCIFIATGALSAGYAGSYTEIGNSGTQQRFYGHGIYQSTGSSTAVHITTGGQLLRFSSSRRYKRAIEDVVPSEILEKIMKLQVKEYNYLYEQDQIDDGLDIRCVGLIAEEVAEIEPCWVGFNKEGLPDDVHHYKINSALISVIQEQQKKIMTLEKRLEVIEDKLKIPRDKKTGWFDW